MLPHVNLNLFYIDKCPVLDFLDALQIILGTLATAKLGKSDPVHLRHVVLPSFSVKVGGCKARESRHACRVNAREFKLESLA